ncbi:unnamed protein product [Rotaria sordida]|uniref:C2H2-type domain-containing protein n=1 Tax=Rotaria sordida TaxID=392033 RepID=A0A818K2V3_9BILA|nr:unnamed protein product [Rotaria sordida]CAF3552769.1 unnamed protein product [Rotaria sordida]
MATRTSTRSTKAVKFVDSADDDEGEFDNSSAIRIKNEPKKAKTRGRTRRNQTNDDEDWDARNEQSEEDDENDDESIDNGDVTKKFKTNTVNRSIDSVYDFGEMSNTTRKWSKTTTTPTPQRNSTVSDTGKSMEKLMCSYCNYTTAKKYLLQRHLKSHSTERPHKCAYCDRSFKTTIQLTNHVNTHLGVKPFQCKFCSFSFTTSGELIRHVRYKHTLEKPHRCDECGYATVELSKLRRHIRTHTGEKPYACPHCSYCSPDTFKLKRHLRVHTGERPYQCTICNFRFTQSNSLKAHMLTHQAEKPSFPCSYCPSVMARKSDLRYHIGKQHARQSEPLSCTKCDEDFPDKYSLRMHGKTHKGQTIHSCTHCEFSANTSQQLDDHMNKHRGTRPFQCSECGLMFAARADLRAHVTRTHRNALTPAITSTPTPTTTINSPTTTINHRPQRRAASLQHRFIGVSSGADDDEHQEDDFHCPICHRQFTSARLLDRHTYAVHEPKQDSYDDRDYQTNDIEDDDDDIHDYADDELEEKPKINMNNKNDIHINPLKVEEGITDDEQIINEEEHDLAPNVEDIIENIDDDDDDNNNYEQIPTIKSISSASKKQIGIIRKFDEIDDDDDLSNKRKCNIIRASFKSNDDEKPDFDVFGFDG